jgi:hypothetical protein
MSAALNASRTFQKIPTSNRRSARPSRSIASFIRMPRRTERPSSSIQREEAVRSGGTVPNRFHPGPRSVSSCGGTAGESQALVIAETAGRGGWNILPGRASLAPANIA